MIRVLTLNIHKGFNVFGRFILPELRELLRLANPDLLCLQEVVGENSRLQRRIAYWPDGPQHSYLAEGQWLNAVYGKNALYRYRNHGNAIISHFPIKNWTNRNVSQSWMEQRGILRAQLEIAGKHVSAFSIHFGLRAKWRRRQVAALIEILKEEVDPTESVVIAGDFNEQSSYADTLLAAQGFSNVCDSKAGREVGRRLHTYPSFFPVMALDRIYVRGFAVCAIQRIGDLTTKFSDHAGLIVDLE